MGIMVQSVKQIENLRDRCKTYLLKNALLLTQHSQDRDVFPSSSLRFHFRWQLQALQT